MNVLFITQKVDRNDDVLGFFHRWIDFFSNYFGKLTVICLYKGTVELSGKISVFSLGKEMRESKLKYILNFYKYIWRYRNNYDSVFVHMNAEYVLLGWWLWRLMGKKVTFWYNHTYGNWKAKVAFNLSDKVFHTSQYAFSANTKKSVRMPAGIDVDYFKKDHSISLHGNSILYIGRVSRVKNIDVLIDAVKKINDDYIMATLDIYGSPGNADVEYYREIQNQIYAFGIEKSVRFCGSIPNYKTPAVYSSHVACVNLTPKGNYDKTVLEAMACECVVIVSSEAFAEVLDKKFLFEERDSADLAMKIKTILNLSNEERVRYGRIMREYVIRNHSLDCLAKKLFKELS